MKEESKLFTQGVESFMTGSYSTAIHAIANQMERLSKEDRIEFASGFKYAQDIFSK